MDPAVSDTLLAAIGNQYDPASFVYSADPTNVFSPVYSVAPLGAETVTATDAAGDVFGTQEYSLSTLGIPLSTFTGYVEYSPGDASNPLALLFGNPYIEDINVTGVPGTLLPENTGFLVEQFGGGWGNVLEEVNITGSPTTVGDFLETPFGNENITPIIQYLMNYTGSAAAEAVPAATDGTPVSVTTDIGLLTTAQTDISDGLTALSQLEGTQGTIPPALAELTGQFEAIQTPLLTSGNPVFSGLGEVLFNGPDQQLADSSAAFLSAADAYVADPTSAANTLDLISAGFGFDGSLLGESLPVNIFGSLVDKLFDLTPAADLAASVDPVTAVDPSIFADLLSFIGL
ncbi:hypothetical protein PT015_09325 [Candidatus Mycobacterium wuenschmannii]|uniref:PE-PGRS family protein n=1 Tax=Candidatus Mycobacterium wuenschmannii TaxID=3027808 RepID=A0ABY8W739_9MYCO|nr:hypothetical protein [Candidatus Mycobacterium wuenschmannii]WIM89604.1 hypothetical protein PT015_09325 [Candidatus Mycobacterium wuenschmannii]